MPYNCGVTKSKLSYAIHEKTLFDDVPLLLYAVWANTLLSMRNRYSYDA